ncbi:MAG TPA: bacteriohemerythrin [Spirochaetota bacterium]|nr:bacteriohemerythrin [Spirochaetota bacterium]HPI90152.1 bacteriohemerythrin [Spirochaetota bacterium]HPR48911.1 bacteriohemerythrin [Spirochaetota bacterium]
MKNLWNEKMSVGVRQFDEHHKKIINMIYDLSQAEEKGISRDEIRNIISELSSYVRYHFIAEERMMNNFKYQETLKHIREHRYFAQRIDDFTNRYASGNRNIDRELLLFLKDWFVKHIMDTDKRYGIFLNSLGVD